MPKQVFKDGKLTIELDDANPKDREKALKKQHKGKNPATLTQKQKVEIFDALVAAGTITL